MIKLKNQDVAEAIALYEQGISQRQIGAKFGVSGQIIGRYIKKAGVETCVGGYNESRTAIKAKHEDIMHWRDRGLTLAEIAEKMSMSPSGVKYVVDRHS